MHTPPLLARRVFRIAGVYGLLALLPLYALEGRIGAAFPPAITHPEHFYGFVGVAVAWQLAFLVIASDPPRFRPLMLPAVAEKLLYVGSTTALLVSGRIPPAAAAPAAVDLVLALLFLAAWRRTPASPPSS